MTVMAWNNQKEIEELLYSNVFTKYSRKNVVRKSKIKKNKVLC